MNPIVFGVVGVIIVIVVIAVAFKGGGDAGGAAPAAGAGGNIASKEKLENLGGGAAAGGAASKPLSSQTLDTQIKPPDNKKGDVFEDVQPDAALVTQYQEGTGEGIEEIEERLKEDPNNEDLLDWLAFMYYSNSRLDEAITTYEKAIELNYENEHQHYYLGNAYYKKGQYDKALEEWEVVVSLKPDSKLASNAQERIGKVKEMIGAA